MHCLRSAITTECSGCNGNKAAVIYNRRHHSFRCDLFVSSREMLFSKWLFIILFKIIACVYLKSNIETKSHVSVCYWPFFLNLKNITWIKYKILIFSTPMSLLPLQIFQVQLLMNKLRDLSLGLHVRTRGTKRPHSSISAMTTRQQLRAWKSEKQINHVFAVFDLQSTVCRLFLFNLCFYIW